MRNVLKVALLASALFASFAAFGEATLVSGNADARMKVVVYNPNDVVKVVGHYGYSTDIQFAPGESITAVALGDSLAWEDAPVENHLFVKPREDDAVTNMTVVTSQRVYQFSLDARNAKGLTNGHSSGMYFQVRFDYPQIAAAKAAAEHVAEVERENRDRVKYALERPPVARNWNYYACGDKQLWPSEVFDDGRFTELAYPGSSEIPAVYTINTDGSETLVNGHMNGDFYEIQKTAKRLVLREGKAVACIENHSYNPWGVSDPTNTTSPGVRRLTVAAADDNNIAPGPTLAPAPTTDATATAAGSGATVQAVPEGRRPGQAASEGEHEGGQP